MSEQRRTIKIRFDESLGSLLLGEYWSACWRAHVEGLEPPPLPPNLEEAMKVDLGVRVLELAEPDDSSFPPLRGGTAKRQQDREY
jgi:hypothetical protein